ncbi:MAG: hypothetical protein IJI09_09065 [Clostridia bacterium]|nr:hypothetical protein [Clostridia bacterium]
MSDFEDKSNQLKESGVRITIDSDGIRYDAYEPLSIEDIDDLDCMELEALTREGLEDLLSKAEDLLDEVEDLEPEDEGSEDHDLWEDQLSEVEDFIDRINDRIDELEDEEDEDDE